MINEDTKIKKTVFTDIEISPLMFDFYCTLRDVKNIDEVESAYLNINDTTKKIEVYIYYNEENFEVENKISQLVTNFEGSYKFFPEVYIYPLDMIESKELTLPKAAKEL